MTGDVFVIGHDVRYHPIRTSALKVGPEFRLGHRAPREIAPSVDVDPPEGEIAGVFPVQNVELPALMDQNLAVQAE